MVNQNEYPKVVNEQSTNKDSSAFNAEVKVQTEGRGSSGTTIYAGYFSEEYLQSLRGKLGAKVWDEMRRSESQVAMLMSAIMNPIKSAEWVFEPFDQTPESILQADLVTMCLKEQIDWETFLHEALTFIPFGFSLFEVVHNVVFDDQKFGTFNGILSLGFRSQKTIERWNIEKKSGKLLSVDQYVYSDIGDNAVISGDFLIPFTNSKEGDNYEGISVLRPMFGAWSRKNLYLKLTAIGVEKYALGTPIGTIPAGKEKSEDVAAFKDVLSSYTSHECAYITKPEGWNIEIQRGEFDASKLKEIILLENTEMINSVVANFLALGTNGGGGAFALGTDLSDFFLSGIQSYADLICGVLNRKLIPNLVRLNYGPQRGYPKAKCTGINDKAGKEFSDIVTSLLNAKAIKADNPLEEFLRSQYKMPKADPTTARVDVAPAVVPSVGPKQFSESIQLDEKYRKNFDANKESIKTLMQEHLPVLFLGLKNQLRKKYAAASANDKIKVALKVEVPVGLVSNYRQQLKSVLGEIAYNAIQSARKQVPSKKNIKLCESLDSIQLANPKGAGYYEALPPIVRKNVEAQASLIADTQAADLEKTVLFQFTSSAAASDNIEEILSDVDEAAAGVLDSGVGAGMNLEAAASNAVANSAGQASMSFFFDDEVIDEIESFTFTNEDPVSQICQEMNGVTFAVGDPELDKFQPPLHHNCKSRYVPNLKTSKDNPEIDRGGASLSRKALDSITLSEHIVRSTRDLYRIF